ncbi:F0F1 ATP synthase subunit A [Filimonas lacunae]|nr:F0F1 ATP synthase subunit A [Filimonas lacunae]BAV09161.1 ATP synthase F0 sector subunit a [Filimonas lacunae]
MKYILAVAFSTFMMFFSNVSSAQEKHENGEGQHAVAAEKHGESHEEEKTGDVIIHHVLDSHEFHFFSYGDIHATLPLPIIIYSPERGLSVFSSARFEEGKEDYNGYRIVKEKIVPVDAAGNVDASVRAFDLSMTKNVVQMFIGIILLLVIMLSVAKKYKAQGAQSVPTGFQNAIEPVITFVRDDVAKPNLRERYQKYLPYLLTVFFFILINNILGLIPGSANVTGNIAFTLVLSVISLIVILISTDGHFWAHIFWPPNVPFLVKLILIPVELLGIFIKPAALMIRLFANMTAGHIVILSFVSLIFIFGKMNTGAGYGFSPVSLAFTIFIYVVEILVAFIQAFIFTNLTAVFIGQTFESGHGHDDKNGHHEEVFV